MRSPPRWTDDRLRAERDRAENHFVAERQGEGPTAYYSVWEEAVPLVRRALEQTDALSRVDAAAILNDKTLWQTLRYVCAPRISEEDLWTLVGKKFKVVPDDLAERTAKVIKGLVDSRRFPWVPANRAAEESEIDAAVLATVTLLAHETLGTKRRGIASRDQENRVSELLGSANYVLADSRKPIVILDELERGYYSRERKIGTAKCDIPVRLRDGRLLALECKVSNGPKNSWKRLQREVGGKADTWRGSFGGLVIAGAVLSGVFDLKCLADAQNKQNVTLFWQHDLSPLLEFVS